MRTTNDAWVELYHAAIEVLDNLIDADEFGPDPSDLGPTDSHPRDDDGDPWYSDTWRLREALDAIHPGDVEDHPTS